MTTEQKMIYARDIVGWTANENGDVFNKKGKKIGYLNNKGYLCSSIKIDKKSKKIKMHQFVFWYFNNYIPKIIDHKNRIKNDNSLQNLRDISQQENCWNTNTNGVSYHKQTKKWRARIGYKMKRIHIGMFDTQEEAINAYIKAKKIYHKI